MDWLNKLLGKLPAKSDPRALMLARFVEMPKALPARTHFWPRRKAFPIRSFGNTEYGDCTRASQAILAMRMERLETRRTPSISDDEIIRVYKEMTTRLYGADWENDPRHADTGAYETDALSAWRRPDETFRDTKGRPLTIDAYLRINHTDHRALKEALVTAGAHGIKVCLNLPAAYIGILPPADWDIPAGQPLIGDWQPGSWGGHSMSAVDYDEKGIWMPHQWNIPDQRITWAAAAAYLDEAHLIVDSLDTWRRRGLIPKKVSEAIKSAVNDVSDTKLK